MAVQGSVKVQKVYEKKVGLGEFKVVGFNPSREELEKLLGIPELERDPEYLKQDDEGNQKLNLSIWLEHVKADKQLFNLRISLKDTQRTNKDGSKHQYVNTAGATTWADSPENLPSWFLQDGRDNRIAHTGEEELYTFMRSWLNGLELRDPKATLEIDWKKLMRGNVRELIDLMATPYAQTVVALATVRTAENKEGEVVDYQQVYNRDFLPGYYMKDFRLGGKKVPKQVQKFIDRIEDPEYGCKEFFGLTLGPLQTYNPEQNIATSEATSLSSDGPDLE